MVGHFLYRRREFITLLSATAVGSAVARAQQHVRRIGILMNLAADDPEGQARVAAFLQGLQETGWVVSRNAQIDIRWGLSGDPERIRKNVTELVAITPDVIFATTFPIVAALQQMTRAVPIVFAGGCLPGLRVLSRVSPSMPSAMNRACHRHTTGFDLPDRRMISAVPQPSAVARMMLARQTCFCGALRSVMIASSR